MNDLQIKHMVDRFLGWKLPTNFNPDGGISFEPEYNREFMAKQGKPPMRHEPTGTNLFDATQAEAMVRHLVEGMPSRVNGDGEIEPAVKAAAGVVTSNAETLKQQLRDFILKTVSDAQRHRNPIFG